MFTAEKNLGQPYSSLSTFTPSTGLYFPLLKLALGQPARGKATGNPTPAGKPWHGSRPHAESFHIPPTNQHSARCRTSQSKQTYVARANFCFQPSQHRVRAGSGAVEGFDPPSRKSLVPSNWLGPALA
ncbi:hypothetical protein mRhiFer1_010020 [Rhinolophus ferrumequinum]|uniref:Uncharacterized protein n=1 Tax=Rhinolophus ferrumequinum TaxID=59479 RepID=A0A7J7Y5Z6_RHIFE|nr:hypothetical protein mRhiFer1_010020 [Rhinolophus ferrumequinum]